MNEEATDNKETNGDVVAPPSERASAQPNSATEENGTAGGEPNRLQHFWNDWKTIPVDRKIELFVGFAILMAAIVSARVAARQWGAMTESNQINRDAFTTIQRAFVTVSSFDTPIRIGPSGGEKFWNFIPNVKNSGNTPTKNLRYYIGTSCPPIMSVSIAGHMTIYCDLTRTDLVDPVDIFSGHASPGGHEAPITAGILGPQTSMELGESESMNNR